jgi:uncharacterized protein (DUF488 family)
MKIYTIGFTKTSAESFFARLKTAGVKKVVDVRLNNVSQLAGFAKRDDLRYFLRAICAIDYEHRPELAPTKEMLDAYKKNGGAWPTYEKEFVNLMRSRHIEKARPDSIDQGCLLCSEDTADHCHRRLVAEYLRDKWVDVEIIHL